MPDGKAERWRWSEQFPLAGAVSKYVTAPIGSEAFGRAETHLRYGFATMPFNPFNRMTWQSGEPGELRSLGYSDRVRFEATMAVLPWLSGGWHIAGKRQYGEWSGGREKEQGFDLIDPWGDNWVISFSNRGSVHMKNITKRWPRATLVGRE